MTLEFKQGSVERKVRNGAKKRTELKIKFAIKCIYIFIIIAALYHCTFHSSLSRALFSSRSSTHHHQTRLRVLNIRSIYPVFIVGWVSVRGAPRSGRLEGSQNNISLYFILFYSLISTSFSCFLSLSPASIIPHTFSPDFFPHHKYSIEWERDVEGRERERNAMINIENLC